MSETENNQPPNHEQPNQQVSDNDTEPSLDISNELEKEQNELEKE